MKKQVFSTRNLILMFAPVIFVLIMLNLGIPQQLLTAVHVGGESYNVVEYNYYFCTEYYDFVTENYNRLDEVGLDVRRSLKRQSYDGEQTWRDHFQALTLNVMQEYAILRSEAEAAGFDARGQVDQVLSQKAEELREATLNGGFTKIDSYLTSYYDGGMTEEIFYEQLARQTLAEAYREVVLEQLAPEEAAVEEYKRANLSGEDYATADVVIAFFAPALDRVTGQAEERQWDNARTLAEAALERAQAEGGTLDAYTDIARRYSQLADGPEEGRYPALTKDGLEDELADWCFDPAREAGDTAIRKGESGWYLVYFNGWGESSLTVEAQKALLEERYQQWLEERAGQWPVTTNAIPMLIAK